MAKPSCDLTNVIDNWAESLEQARAVQQEMAPLVSHCDDFAPLQFVAGADSGFEKSGSGQEVLARGVIAVMSWPDLELVEYAMVQVPVSFPYIPGYLSFRECPALLSAWQQLSIKPDLVFCDGQGVAHPRRFGIACHFGLLAGVPTIGVGKSRLTGAHHNVGEAAGESVELFDKGEIIGAVLRTRNQVKPLYISTGHGISLSSSVRLVLDACRGYRLPEPVRWADGIASRRPGIIKKLAERDKYGFCNP